MMLSEKEFRITLFERGITLDESLNSSCFQPKLTEQSKALAISRLNSWINNANLFDENGFTKRCNNLNIEHNEEFWLSKLGEQEFTGDFADLPSWTKEAYTLLINAINYSSDSKTLRKYLMTWENDVPFIDLWYGMVEYCVDSIEDVDVNILNKIELQAIINGHAHQLLSDVAKNMATALELEFSLFRLANNAQTLESASGSKKFYTNFIYNLLSGEFATFMLKYSLCTRRLVTIVNNWKINVTNFIHRLDKDYLTISKRFNIPCDSTIVSLTSGLSDPHNGGQTVCKVTYSSGDAIYYKPRTVIMAKLYSQILTRYFTQFQLHAPEVIDCTTYGWSKGVAYKNTDPDTYFKKAGHVLAVAKFLNFTDLHNENLVVSAFGPAIVDCETMLSGIPIDTDQNDISQIDFYTVARSSLLPYYHLTGDNNSIRISGIESHTYTSDGIRSRSWKYINTDKMVIVEGLLTENNTYNTLKYNQTIGSSIDKYIDTLIEGFEMTYDYIHNTLDLKEIEEYVDQVIGNQKIRVLFRDTSVYEGLNVTISSPDLLAYSIDAAIESEKLYAAILPGINDVKLSDLQYIVSEEVNSVLQGDVPFFLIPFKKNASKTRQNIQISLLKLSGKDLLGKTNELYSYPDQVFQKNIIKSSIYNYSNYQYKKAKHISSLCTRDEILHEAITIVEQVWHFRSSKYGHNEWSINEPKPNISYNIQLMDFSLYTGKLGIILVNSLVYVKTGTNKYKERAIILLEEFYATISSALNVDYKLNHHGLVYGYPSYVRGLAWIAQILGDSQILDKFLTMFPLKTALLNNNVWYGDLLLGDYGSYITSSLKHVLIPESFKHDIDINELANLNLSAAHGLSGFYHIFKQKNSATGVLDKIVRLILEKAEMNWNPMHQTWMDQAQSIPTYSWSSGSLGIIMYLQEELSANVPEIFNLAVDRLRKDECMHYHDLMNGQSSLVDLWISFDDLESARKVCSDIINKKRLEGTYRFSNKYDNSLLTGLMGIAYSFLRTYDNSGIPAILDFNA